MGQDGTGRPVIIMKRKEKVGKHDSGSLGTRVIGRSGGNGMGPDGTGWVFTEKIKWKSC